MVLINNRLWKETKNKKIYKTQRPKYPITHPNLSY